MLKVNIYPSWGDEDKGDGGIRRVVEAQIKHLPKFDIEVVERAEDADVIAAHATVPSTYLKRFPDKTFVALCHGLYWSEYEWDNWALKANAEVMENIRCSDAVTTCSEWVANALRRHTNRPVEVIYHGIDSEDWQGGDTLPYVLWNKTRPDPVCDPEPMNQAAAYLRDVQFVSTFGKEASNVKLTGKVSFEDSKELVRRAGVYLCTTRETFGIGTLEALACGVPVVGFDFGGQHEFIENGVDGWLVRPGDIPGLVNAIKYSLEHREEMREACIRKAKLFTWEKACAQYAELFRNTYSRKHINTPRTSIIVTNYDLHEYLPQCLDSVLAQTDQDWECVVVDDASPTADGREIIHQYILKDGRFRIIANPKNVYLAEARNIGIRAATGKYILPLDADDMLAPGAVLELANALDTDKTIHVAYGNVKFVDQDGLTPTNYGKQFEPGYSSWPYPFVHEQQIMQRNLLPYCSMFRKEAWENTGGYRRRCRTAEDADLWTRLSSYGYRPKMVTSVDTLVYRNREGSMSRTNESEWISWFTWSKVPEVSPAGAVTKDQLPIPSLDPIIISVVIPVGPGHERIVTDSVDSVESQTFQMWECIVVNDTGKPLPTELPSWVRVVNTQGKTGPAAARNAGIRTANGRLFLPLDADDYLEPKALETMYRFYQETKDIVYTDFYQTDMSGKEISIHQCDDYDPRLITGGSRIVKGKQRQGMIHTVTALTPLAVWEKVGGYDENLEAWEDWDFQLKCGDVGACSIRVPMPLFMYRKHTGFRREENMASFDAAKEGILRKWKHLWEGGKELLACTACSKRSAPILPLNQSFGVRAHRVGSEEAALVKYVGPKLGATPFRGASKTMYWFAQGDVKYVLAQDVPLFEKMPEQFMIIPQESVAPPSFATPTLVAEGQA